MGLNVLEVLELEKKMVYEDANMLQSLMSMSLFMWILAQKLQKVLIYFKQ